MQDQIIEEKRIGTQKDRRSLTVSGEGRRSKNAVRKLRKYEEMAWPDWEEARKMEDEARARR